MEQQNENRVVEETTTVRDEATVTAEAPAQPAQESTTDTWGIVSFVMGLIGFFTGAGVILFGSIGFLAGLKSRKSAFGIIGLILSGLQLLLFVFIIMGLYAYTK